MVTASDQPCYWSPGLFFHLSDILIHCFLWIALKQHQALINVLYLLVFVGTVYIRTSYVDKCISALQQLMNVHMYDLIIS